MYVVVFGVGDQPWRCETEDGYTSSSEQRATVHKNYTSYLKRHAGSLEDHC